MKAKSVAVLLGLAAAGCDWPFSTETTCVDLGNCGSEIPDGQAGSSTGGASGDASTGGRGANGTGGAGGSSGTGGASGTGGVRDGGPDGDADAAPPCDATASPSVATCVIDDAHGIFVSPKGSDATGDGSQAHPYASLAQAMSAVTATKRRIYACADGGAYAETIQTVAALDGIAFFGGFHCKDWTYDSLLKAQLTSPSTTAWTVNGLTKGLTVEDFVITAANATASGTSSIAMVVNQSKNVVLRRVTINAGNGADGAAGATGDKGIDGDPAGADQAGKAAVCGASAPGSQLGGVWNNASTCGSQGGGGGTASKNANGAKGNPGAPDTGVTPSGLDNGGAGSTVISDDAPPGTNGSKGDDGTVGVAAATLGLFTLAGYTPEDGHDGTDGHPGQGGGGGGASKGNGTCVGASGGAGGMGGCGGGHGGAGKGGGASVALTMWQSTVTLDSVSLIAATGGAGGKGGNGGGVGNGQVGALGGPGDGTAGIGRGGRGGDGGNGGRGGSGSGGTGGPSYALLFNGTPPTKTAVTVTQGQGGAKGAGGFVEGTTGTNPAPDGTDGDAAPEHEVP
jgi:hypothetical protein